MKEARTANILVVEDEPAVQELLTFNMEQCGYRVIRAYGVSEALAHIHRALSLPDLILPDLIMLDWMLPDGYGIDLARVLREDARTYRIPIIMLTARTDECDKTAGLRAGADDYITKPFSPRELMARIRDILGGRILSPPLHHASTGKEMADMDLGSSDVMWL